MHSDINRGVSQKYQNFKKSETATLSQLQEYIYAAFFLSLIQTKFKIRVSTVVTSLLQELQYRENTQTNIRIHFINNKLTNTFSEQFMIKIPYEYVLAAKL